MRHFFLTLLFASTMASPAAADSDSWQHPIADIAVDKAGPGLALSQSKDMTGGDNLDTVLQFGTQDDPATVYIYRSSFPNPALWIDKTLIIALNRWEGMPKTAPAPTPITVSGASAPNGLRVAVEAVGDGPFRTTAIAFVHHNGWMLKYRISSKSLGLDDITKRIDQLISMTHFPAAKDDALPLKRPEPCQTDNKYAGELVKTQGDEAIAQVMASMIMAHAAAMGVGGPAGEPDKWCEITDDGIEEPSIFSYRSKEAPDNWVILLGDDGSTVSAFSSVLPDLTSGPDEEAPATNAALFVHRRGKTTALAPFTSLPPLNMPILNASIPFLLGEKQGMVSMSIGTEDEGKATKSPSEDKETQ